MTGNWKSILWRAMRREPWRRQIIRYSKAAMNVALGDNNDDRATNGECLVIENILSATREKKQFIVFDVGANVGEWTKSVLKMMEKRGFGEGGRQRGVYCFEPSVFSFSQLQVNLKEMGRGIVHLVNMGLGDAQGIRELHIIGDGAGTNSLYRRRLDGLGLSFQKSENVQMTTVDDYCRENHIAHIDLLKIDVEGHEISVVRGAKEMFEGRAIDFVQFEYGGTWIDSRVLFRDMYDLLAGFGYGVGKILPTGVEFYERYDHRLETFQMANYVGCLPEKRAHFQCFKPWMS